MKGFQEARVCGLTALKLGAPGSKGQSVLAAVCDSDTRHGRSQQPTAARIGSTTRPAWGRGPPPGDKARASGLEVYITLHIFLKSLMETFYLFEILLKKLNKTTRTFALGHHFSILILVRSR